MKKEHLCPVSFKHPFLTGWPPWEPEQWQRRVGLLTLKVGSIWMNLIIWSEAAATVVALKPGSPFTRSPTPDSIEWVRQDTWRDVNKTDFNVKMNKKVNTSKVTQSELSEIHAHCKNIKSTWRSSLALSDNPILILWSILTFSYSLYWYYFCTILSMSSAFLPFRDPTFCN